MTAGLLGLSLIFFVFIYTVSLIRSGNLSAHMAISWIIVEVDFLIIMIRDNLRVTIRILL